MGAAPGTIIGYYGPNPLSVALPNAGGSFGITSRDLHVQTYQHGKFTLTAAQIIGMYAAPQLIIPAPPTGYAINPIQTVIEVDPTATQFTGGGVVAPQIGNTVHGGGTLFTTTLAAAVVNGASTVVTQLAGTGANVTLVKSTGSNATAGLYLSNATGAFATGTGTLTVYLIYNLVSLLG